MHHQAEEELVLLRPIIETALKLQLAFLHTLVCKQQLSTDTGCKSRLRKTKAFLPHPDKKPRPRAGTVSWLAKAGHDLHNGSWCA